MIPIITAFMERRKSKRYHRCLRIGCRKAATYYGRFVGGLCTEHAAEYPDQLHPEDRARLIIARPMIGHRVLSVRIIRFGGWFPWDVRREARKHGWPARYGHGWAHLSIRRWHFHFSWDRLSGDATVDYDAIP